MPDNVVMNTAESIISAYDIRFHNIFSLSLAILIRDQLRLKFNIESLMSITEMVIGETLLLSQLFVNNGKLLEPRGFIALIKATSTRGRDG